MADITTHARLASTRLLQLKTSVHRQRTAALIIKDTDSVPANSPYDIIAIGAEVTHKLVAAGAPVVAAYWPTVTSADLEKAEGYKFIIAAPGASGERRIDMDTFDDLYPHFSDTWDGSADHAVNLLSRLLYYDTCIENLDTVPKFHLLVQLWKPASGRRWREIYTALKRNAENPFVHRIHVMQENDDVDAAWAKWPAALKEKLIVLPVNSMRLTYRSALDYMARLPPGDYAAFANADIYFDKTLRELWTTDFKNTCLALLRYEASVEDVESEPKLFGPRDDSQDAWIFRVEDLAAAGAESWRALTFTLGLAGCDNAFAGELVRRRWRVANPCMSIRALHLHESAVRTYRKDDLVTLGVYATVAPTGVLEIRLLDTGNFATAGHLEVSKPSVCAVTVYNKEGRDLLSKTLDVGSIGDKAVMETVRVKVLRASSGCIVTADGLMTYHGGIGFSEDMDASQLAWTQTKYNRLTPIKVVEQGIFVPCASRHAADELLRLGRALAMVDCSARPISSSADLKGCVMPSAWARLFDGLTGTLQLIDSGERALLCQQGAIGQLPSIQQRSAAYAGPAVAALRRHLLPVVGHNVDGESGWVLFGAEDEMVDALGTALNGDIVVTNYVNPNAAPGRLLPTIRVASVIVGNEWSLGYMWAAVPGATYIDMAPSAAAAALATICGLRYVPMGGSVSVADLIAASAQ